MSADNRWGVWKSQSWEARVGGVRIKKKAGDAIEVLQHWYKGWKISATSGMGFGGKGSECGKICLSHRVFHILMVNDQRLENACFDLPTPGCKILWRKVWRYHQHPNGRLQTATDVWLLFWIGKARHSRAKHWTVGTALVQEGKSLVDWNHGLVSMLESSPWETGVNCRRACG